MDKLMEALQKLDAGNDNHWTQDGSPRLETVKFNMGGTTVSREEIESAFPGFNKSTAAAYWLTYQNSDSGAAQGEDSAVSEQGSEESTAGAVAGPQAEQGGEQETESPSASGEGATPSEEAPDKPDLGDGAEPTPSEAEQPEVELGPEPVADEITSLETSFQEIQEHLTGLRDQVANLNAEIDRVASIEAQVYKAIEVAKLESNKHKPANVIQDYLAQQKRISVARGAARKNLSEQGINMKELQKVLGKSPLDQSMARPTARRGRGSSGM